MKPKPSAPHDFPKEENMPPFSKEKNSILSTPSQLEKELVEDYWRDYAKPFGIGHFVRHAISKTRQSEMGDSPPITPAVWIEEWLFNDDEPDICISCQDQFNGCNYTKMHIGKFSFIINLCEKCKKKFVQGLKGGKVEETKAVSLARATAISEVREWLEEELKYYPSGIKMESRTEKNYLSRMVFLKIFDKKFGVKP